MSDRGSNLSILLVTKEQAVFEMTKRLLADGQCEVREAKNSHEALVTILDNSIDVVILDAEASGDIDVGLAPIIKRLRPKISLILVLDNYSTAALEKVISCGIVYHAVKPVDDTELVEVVKAIRKKLYPRQLQ
ncbi:MAG: response regulator [Acidobacteria bacterium]|nr:response regulator [Acidobacteriota bacterium]